MTPDEQSKLIIGGISAITTFIAGILIMVYSKNDKNERDWSQFSLGLFMVLLVLIVLVVLYQMSK